MLSCLFGIMLAVAAVGSTPAQRDAIIAEAAGLAPRTTAFDRMTKTVREGGGSTTASQRIDRWNGRSWSLVSVAGKPPSRDQREQYRRIIKAMPVPGYHQLADILASASGSAIDAQGRTMWLVPQLPAGSVVTDSGDISVHLKAEARVAQRGDRLWIDQLRISQREPFRLNVLIKVTGFTQTMDFSLGPDGKPRLVAQSSQSTGNMFGFPGGEKAEVTFVYR